MELDLQTERLFLKPIGDHDIDFIISLELRPETNQYDGTPLIDDVKKRCVWFIDRAKTLPNEGAIKWIALNEKGNKLGEIHLTCNWEETNEWEIGYKLLHEYWGQGYATEAVTAVINFSFENFLINKLMAFINAENTKSVALAKRIGMIQEGYMREARMVNGIRYDEIVFSLLRKDRHSAV